jgi:aminoglycoside phosphotransferase
VLGALRARYSRYTWEPVSLGMSTAHVWSVGPFFVKAGRPSPLMDGLHPEATRLVWLEAAGIPAPKVVEHGSDGDIEWLVMTAVPGRTAAHLWPEDQRDRVVDAIADFTAWLHSMPVDDCPFDRSLNTTVSTARSALAAGLVDLADLDQERSGWTGAQLEQALLSQLPTSEDLVITHGDASLPNFLLDPETLEVTGIVDIGRLGLADRHTDLGITTRSLGSGLNRQYPPGSGDRFLKRYAGAAPDALLDASKIEYYRLLDEFF